MAEQASAKFGGFEAKSLEAGGVKTHAERMSSLVGRCYRSLFNVVGGVCECYAVSNIRTETTKRGEWLC